MATSNVDMAAKVVAALAAFVTFAEGARTLQADASTVFVPEELKWLVDNQTAIFALALGTAYASTGDVRATTYATLIVVIATFVYYDLKEEAEESYSD